MRRLLLAAAAASRRSSAASLPAAPLQLQRMRPSGCALARGIAGSPASRIHARDDEPSSAPGRSAPEDSEKDAQREFVRWVSSTGMQARSPTGVACGQTRAAAQS